MYSTESSQKSQDKFAAHRSKLPQRFCMPIGNSHPHRDCAFTAAGSDSVAHFRLGALPRGWRARAEAVPLPTYRCSCLCVECGLPDIAPMAEVSLQVLMWGSSAQVFRVHMLVHDSWKQPHRVSASSSHKHFRDIPCY